MLRNEIKLIRILNIGTILFLISLKIFSFVPNDEFKRFPELKLRINQYWKDQYRVLKSIFKVNELTRFFINHPERIPEKDMKTAAVIFSFIAGTGNVRDYSNVERRWMQKYFNRINEPEVNLTFLSKKFLRERIKKYIEKWKDKIPQIELKLKKNIYSYSNLDNEIKFELFSKVDIFGIIEIEKNDSGGECFDLNSKYFYSEDEIKEIVGFKIEDLKNKEKTKLKIKYKNSYFLRTMTLFFKSKIIYEGKEISLESLKQNIGNIESHKIQLKIRIVKRIDDKIYTVLKQDEKIQRRKGWWIIF